MSQADNRARRYDSRPEERRTTATAAGFHPRAGLPSQKVITSRRSALKAVYRPWHRKKADLNSKQISAHRQTRTQRRLAPTTQESGRLAHKSDCPQSGKAADLHSIRLSTAQEDGRLALKADYRPRPRRAGAGCRCLSARSRRHTAGLISYRHQAHKDQQVPTK